MRADRRPARGERGITLIETLVALSLLAISAATISNFLVQQIRASNTNSNYTIAYELAVQELEDVRAQLYDQMGTRSKDHKVGGIDFDIETQVTEGTPAPNMKKIDVAVSWNEPSGDRNVALHTIYTAVTR
jgi:type II secretion system protein I